MACKATTVAHHASCNMGHIEATSVAHEIKQYQYIKSHSDSVSCKATWMACKNTTGYTFSYKENTPKC